MKFFLKISIISTLALLAVGCTNQENDSVTPEAESMQGEVTDTPETTEIANEEESKNLDASNEELADQENVVEKEPTESKGMLDTYSNEEIEYARVWLQFGVNPEFEELHIEEIPEGTPINSLDEGSLDYPENVVQLRGSRLVDGVVTYSSNGDGTINLYNVPARWENPESYGNDSAIMEEETRKIIENTETEYVEPGNDEEVADVASRIQ